MLVKRCSACRLGTRGGGAELKAHPFFAGFDWHNVGRMRAPNIPSLKGDLDTSNFENFEEEDAPYPGSARRRTKRADPDFMCFTYKNMQAVSRDESRGVVTMGKGGARGAQRPNFRDLQASMGAGEAPR